MASAAGGSWPLMSFTDEQYRTMHIGRHWSPAYSDPNFKTIEDECPCPTEDCGHVARDKIDPECPQHGREAMKTLRSGHLASDCPGKPVQVSVSDGRS